MVRPTGLTDPEVVVKPTKGQIDDLMEQIKVTVERGDRVLVTTLTKKMAEDLTDYLLELGVRVRYLHSNVDTVQRIEILRDLRLGEFDVLVGINLLREGLDLPEVSLVCILDADKEGFLRSETSLIQTMGRAARNVDGQVIMYADKVTDSMQRAISETNRRRGVQEAYNLEHGIDPQTIRKAVTDILATLRPEGDGKSPDAGQGPPVPPPRPPEVRLRRAAPRGAGPPHPDAGGGDEGRRRRPPLRVRRPPARRGPRPQAGVEGDGGRAQADSRLSRYLLGDDGHGDGRPPRERPRDPRDRSPPAPRHDRRPPDADADLDTAPTPTDDSGGCGTGPCGPTWSPSVSSWSPSWPWSAPAPASRPTRAPPSPRPAPWPGATGGSSSTPCPRSTPRAPTTRSTVAEGPRGIAPFAKHPLYALVLAGAQKVGGINAMVALSLLGTLAAAALGAALASRIGGPGLARPALWALGLASPLLFDGYLVIAHTIGAALAAAAVLVAAVAIQRRRPLLALAVGPLVAVAVLFRTEALLFGVALAVGPASSPCAGGARPPAGGQPPWWRARPWPERARPRSASDCGRPPSSAGRWAAPVVGRPDWPTSASSTPACTASSSRGSGRATTAGPSTSP